MSNLKRIPLVKFALDFKVCLAGFLRRVKVSYMDSFPVYLYSCGKPFLVSTDSEKSKNGIRVSNSLILVINGSADIAQIAQSVITSNAIDVINIARWPSAMTVKPSQPVRGMKFAINADRHIPVVKRVCRRKPYGDSVRRWLDPSEYPGVLVVGQTFAKTVAGNIDSSHAVVPYKQWTGQKPACVGSTCGLRHFSQ